MDTEKIAAVSRMQAYIAAHLQEEITLENLCDAAGYSKFHAARVFAQLTGKTPFAYIRALRLTQAAQALRDSNSKVIDVAISSGFDSHDGFTRAFARQFGIAPQRYSRETPPVRYFVSNPVAHAHIIFEEKQPMNETVSTIVTATVVERPARKLVLQRAKTTQGGDYFAYCEEMGCDWEGLLGSIAEKFDTPALLTLPPNLVTLGTSNTAAGVEVPIDYVKPIPAGYDVIELPPCQMLYLNGTPYENEDDFCTAIEIAFAAQRSYDPTPFGRQFAPELAPHFNFGACAAGGAKLAMPVKTIA